MSATEKKNTQMPPPSSLDEALTEQEYALIIIQEGMLAYLQKREDAPTIEQLDAAIDEIEWNLSKINGIVPGGLGINRSLNDRLKIKGPLPPEIKTDDDLKILECRYQQACTTKERIETKLNSRAARELMIEANALAKESNTLAKKGYKIDTVLLAATTGAAIPAASLAVLVALLGPSDLKPFVIAGGAIVAIGIGTTCLAIYDPTIKNEAVNDNSQKPSISDKFRKTKAAITQPLRKVCTKASQTLVSLNTIKKEITAQSKRWIDNNAEKVRGPLQKIKKRFDFGKGPKI
ncbi:MAG: hypothetical protein PHS57_10190 [Alphaproteobacteria bacterium]|nr:hypothetical protein [Alphaproteobacteria bacterium]